MEFISGFVLCGLMFVLYEFMKSVESSKLEAILLEDLEEFEEELNRQEAYRSGGRR